MEERKGKVWLVGAGPGDVGLLTIKAKKLIEECDVVVYDKLVGQGVLGIIPKGKKNIFVGKVAGNHAVPQSEINKILLNEAKEGKKVVRLKGGDPFLFGRGGEELELLVEEGIEFEIVPGITSAISVPAYNGIPVTHRDFVSSLHIITGHTKSKEEAEVDYEALVRLGGTLVFLMGKSAIGQICQGLAEAGMPPDTPAACLARGTRAHQRRVVSDLANLEQEVIAANLPTPAIIIVGQVCKLSEKFSWAEGRPLGKVKIAVTRPLEAASRLAERLSELGAEVVSLPTIETKPLPINDSIENVIKRIKNRKLIVFTSPAGVNAFFEKLFELGEDVRNLANIQFAVVGEATKIALQNYGIIADIMPDIYSGKELGKLLVSDDIKKMYEGTSILLARGTLADEDITKQLDAACANYDDIAFYETLDYKYDELIPINYDEEEIDYVTFTSASTVNSFVRIFDAIDYTKVKALCIGEKTQQAAQKYNMKTIVSEKATIESMIEKLLEVEGE